MSIGPYHHDNESLKAMGGHKRRALIHFLSRSRKTFQCYLDALRPVVNDLKDAYDQLDDKWKQDTEAFLQLMLVDGCFILDLLRTTAAEAEELKRLGYAENDPVFSTHGKLYIVPYLKRDMLMLENQLPMQVLTTLLCAESDTMTNNDISKDKVTELILNFFDQPCDAKKINQRGGECFHILDVYRLSLLSNPDSNRKSKTVSECFLRCCKTVSECFLRCCRPKDELREDEIIRSAMELYEAGVTIEPSKTKSLKDISFNSTTGVLKLPPILVDDTSESQYLNLMAFERFHFGAGNEVSSYIFFMDNIIDNAKDVRLLHSSRIIQNALGSDEAVAKLFNTISKDITLDPKSDLDKVHKQVSGYCRIKCPRWMAFLKHTYFQNPWVGISVVAAIILFVLTGIQTYYSVVSYHQPNKK